MDKKQPSQEMTFEEEFNDLFAYCKNIGLKEDDLSEILEPFESALKKEKLVRNLKISIFVLFLCFLGYYAFFDLDSNFAWHLTAIGRIAMIKMLPLIDWQALKNERCLIENKFNNIQQFTTNYNLCNYCEAIDEIPVFFVNLNSSENDLNLNLKKINQPLIIVESNEFEIGKNLSDLTNDEFYLNSYPCKLSSNLINSNYDVNLNEVFFTLDEFILSKEKYFLHFQNCDFRAVKQFRKHFPKPAHLKSLSPVQYSWLLLSKNYNLNKKNDKIYKLLNFNDKIIYFKQIKGSNLIKLSPFFEECLEKECPILKTTLHEGESLIFTNSHWNFEYLPRKINKKHKEDEDKDKEEEKEEDKEEINLAVILEMH